MKATKCVAMILAGGQGSRLGILTSKVAKPAVTFGGKYRIIDFALSNCVHSGINTIGVLTQYKPLELNTYIGNGSTWDLDRNDGGVFVLPPYQKEETGEWYKGTANAIYQNIEFVDQYNPDHVVILSGDHIYKMDYNKMMEYHEEKGAAATIAVIPVPWEEASRFGIMETDGEGTITRFAEKPKEPKSNLASMGVYVFKWSALKEYLIRDEKTPGSENDFGKNIIPAMLDDGQKLCAYGFEGYWKDVGTVQSLWEANMDLLSDPPVLDMYDTDWRIFSRNPVKPPHYVADGASVANSCITEGCNIYGDVKNCILSEGVTVGKGSVVEDSILFPGVTIGDNAVVKKVIIGSDTVLGNNVVVGDKSVDSKEFESKYCSADITLIGGNITIADNTKIGVNAMITKSIEA
ncbi:MAG: glucose-1-phosphate adenylyltransferase [Clostridia bacterium]|nr:glucose-1-phosphate adenylyltransferase [Clostridia bacterium]